jgi:hypothetical protein
LRADKEDGSSVNPDGSVASGDDAARKACAVVFAHKGLMNSLKL